MSQVPTKADDQAIIESKGMATADTSATNANDQDYMTTGMGKTIGLSEWAKELEILPYIHPISGKDITFNQFIEIDAKLGKLNVKAKTIDDMTPQLMAPDRDEQHSWVKYLRDQVNKSVDIQQLFDTWKRNTYGRLVTYDLITGEHPNESGKHLLNNFVSGVCFLCLFYYYVMCNDSLFVCLLLCYMPGWCFPVISDEQFIDCLINGK